MKKTIIFLIFIFVSLVSFSQKWRVGLGVEGGMGGGGMTALLKTTNPVITDNSELKKGFVYSGGGFLQVMRPGYGLETRLVYNSFSAEAESFSSPESISLRYLSVPVLFKVRLSTREGITSPSWSSESYSLIGNTIYHTPGQYSAGGSHFTINVFLYGGVQYDMLKKATHTYGTIVKTTDDISGRLTEAGSSLIGGLEISADLISFDFSYQSSIKSVYPGMDNKVNAFLFKLKLRIL